MKVRKSSAIGGGTMLAVRGTLNVSGSPFDLFKLRSSSSLEYRSFVAD
jgi:hypothetical protein